MSILSMAQRPWVEFDPSDPEHRQHYLTFLQHSSWRGCPVQFRLQKGYGDLSSMIENKLTAFYLGREFGYKVEDRSGQWMTS